jgi:hypothetical protein
MQNPSSSFRNVLRGVIIIAIALGAITILVQHVLIPVLSPTPTLAGDPATIYIGNFANTQASIGLIVSSTQTRALICTENDTQWQTIDAWLPTGTNQGGTLNANNSSIGASLTAHITGDTAAGTYIPRDGSNGSEFTAQRVADSAPEGVYYLPFASQQADVAGGTDMRLLVLDAKKSVLCGGLWRGNNLLSRVETGIWQAGFSDFALVDMLDKDKNPLVLHAPGALQHIVGIAAH